MNLTNKNAISLEETVGIEHPLTVIKLVDMDNAGMSAQGL